MAGNPAGFIGRSVKPHKAARFLTGSGIYVGDIRLPDMLHAALVRSIHAHARIRAVDVQEALQLDGVAGVWTGRDIEGRISLFPESFEIHPEIRERLSGNLCRCTGYQNIVAAVLWAAEHLRVNSDR